MKAARIDEIVLHPDNRVEIHYTEGEAPLPPTWQSQGMIFGTRAEFLEALQVLEDDLANQKLMLLQCAKAAKQDPTLGTQFVNAARGRTAYLDLLGMTGAITLG